MLSSGSGLQAVAGRSTPGRPPAPCPAPPYGTRRPQLPSHSPSCPQPPRVPARMGTKDERALRCARRLTRHCPDLIQREKLITELSSRHGGLLGAQSPVASHPACLGVGRLCVPNPLRPQSAVCPQPREDLEDPQTRPPPSPADCVWQCHISTFLEQDSEPTTSPGSCANA